MKKFVSLFRFPLLLAFFLLIASCSRDPEKVNFLLNNRDLETSEEQPEDANDTLKVLKLLVGDKVYLKAIAEPKHRAKSIRWDTDGDGNFEEDPEINDKGWLGLHFEQPGFQKVTLQVNGKEELTLSKWVYVEEAILASPAPVLTLKKPTERETTSRDKTYTIEVETANVLNKEELAVSLNSEPVSNFSFDANTGLLKSRLRLSEGSNFVRVTAGMESKDVLIVYEKPERPEPKPKPASKPAPPTPSKSGVAAPALSAFESGAACLENSGSSFTMKIKPKQDIELLSFKFFTDNCGGIAVVLNGPEGSQTFQGALVQGKNQISFGDMDARLKKNVTYTLTCTAEAGRLECASTEAAHFLNLKKCGAPAATTPQLTLDFQNNHILFDLNYLYR